MNNDKIEKMLYEAQEKLPTTNSEWKSFDLMQEQTKKKIIYKNKIVVACLAFVLFLGIGSVTALASIEMDINPHDYGQWVDYLNCGGWKKCEKLMRKRGFVVPENFGDYKFTACDAWLVAKHGDTYWDALIKNVYNPISITYEFKLSNQSENDPKIYIDVGTLDEAYWSAYYGFENVDGVWMMVESEEIFEYENLMIYGKRASYMAVGEAMNWRWIDEENGICWYVTVPIDKGIDSLEVVKTIIGLNCR